MRHPATKVIAAVALVCLLPAAGFALTPYSQNFESLVPTSLTALSADGWVVYGNVFTPLGVYIYGYGVYPAPNAGSAFCTIDAGQGGVEQGAQQLSVFSDYENTAHAGGNLIESNVFHEQTVTAGDVGNTWVFAFDGKRGNLSGLSTAKAFVKTLNPAAGYATTNFLTVDMTTAPDTWVNHSISIVINAGLVGQLLQFGFTNTATYYESSGIFYDNVDFHLYDPSDVPSEGVAMGAQLRQNYPNPFNPSTRIEFRLEQASNVELAVFDLAGRHLVTLQQGALDAGEHSVTWDGRTAQGAAASAGQYQYVLKTDAGRQVRSMVLLK
jgi:hypothetical protein